MNICRRLLNIVLAFDQLLWVIITLGEASPDETPSAGCWRMELQGKWQGKFFRPIVDWIFLTFFNDDNHCQESYESEVLGLQNHPHYRDEFRKRLEQFKK